MRLLRWGSREDVVAKRRPDALPLNTKHRHPRRSERHLDASGSGFLIPGESLAYPMARSLDRGDRLGLSLFAMRFLATIAVQHVAEVNVLTTMWVKHIFRTTSKEEL